MWDRKSGGVSSGDECPSSECSNISDLRSDKSISLESRLLLWRRLREYYPISTLPLPLPKLWGNLPLLSLWESGWGPGGKGPGGKGHEAVEASIRLLSQKIFLLSWAQIQPPAIHQLSSNRSYQFKVSVASAQVSRFLLLYLSGWTCLSRFQSGFALPPCFSDASKKSWWFSMCPNFCCC